MNPTAILALISDLVERLSAANNEVERLHAELERLQRPQETPDG